MPTLALLATNNKSQPGRVTQVIGSTFDAEFPEEQPAGRSITP